MQRIAMMSLCMLMFCGSSALAQLPTTLSYQNVPELKR